MARALGDAKRSLGDAKSLLVTLYPAAETAGSQG
jgi:hypothetical protein